MKMHTALDVELNGPTPPTSWKLPPEYDSGNNLVLVKDAFISDGEVLGPWATSSLIPGDWGFIEKMSGGTAKVHISGKGNQKVPATDLGKFKIIEKPRSRTNSPNWKSNCAAARSLNKDGADSESLDALKLFKRTCNPLEQQEEDDEAQRQEDLQRQQAAAKEAERKAAKVHLQEAKSWRTLPSGKCWTSPKANAKLACSVEPQIKNVHGRLPAARLYLIPKNSILGFKCAGDEFGGRPGCCPESGSVTCRSIFDAYGDFSGRRLVMEDIDTACRFLQEFKPTLPPDVGPKPANIEWHAYFANVWGCASQAS